MENKLMKNKYNFAVLLLVFIAIITMIVFPKNSVHAEETIFLETEIPEYENLYFKLEFQMFLSDIEGIEINVSDIHNKILFDVEDNPIFILTYTSNNGYMISNRETASSLERSVSGESPYNECIYSKCYYMGYGNYYVHQEGEIIDILNNNEIEVDGLIETQSKLEQMLMLDLTENGTKNYLSRTSNNDRINNSKYVSSEALNYFNKKWSTNKYYNMGNQQYDYLFPENDGSSCGIVACIQLLQYLDRLNIVDTTSNFKSLNNNRIIFNKNDVNFGTNCLTQSMHDELDSMTWSGAFGENYTNNLVSGMNNFFEKYQPKIKVWVTPIPSSSGYYQNANAIITFHNNSFYDNMVAQINNGKPAIGLTSIGNGYYQDASNWSNTSVARHIMIVYGYCTTDKGTLKDFITHSG